MFKKTLGLEDPEPKFELGEPVIQAESEIVEKINKVETELQKENFRYEGNEDIERTNSWNGTPGRWRNPNRYQTVIDWR
jgi:hypothetical protein